MSAQPLIEILEKLLKLHKSLYQLATEKTEVIKKSDTEALNTLINQEKNHIFAIEKMEKERAGCMAKLMPSQKNPPLNACLNFFEKTEQEKLLQLQEELLLTMTDLKSVNNLNQELLQLSLQFVELNLDLLLPQEMPPNYSKTNEEEEPHTNVSLFDSKA